MKKSQFFTTVLIILLCSYGSAFAQKKGDMTIGGTIGVSGGSLGMSISIDNEKEKETSPTTTYFDFAPRFSYFVANNFELSIGLNYSMQKTFSSEINDKKLFNFTHIALAEIGAHYYLSLFDGKMYYAPGLSIGFGGGSYVSQTGSGTSSTLKLPFAFGLSINLANFEFRPIEKLGITVNLLDVEVGSVNIKEDTDAKLNITSFSAGLNYGISAGVKYYF